MFSGECIRRVCFDMMRLLRQCSILLAAVSTVSASGVPGFATVANHIASAGLHADFTELWKELRGDEITASAVATKNRFQMQSAMMLSGTVMAMGVSLPVETNGLKELCDITISSFRNDFFSKTVVQEKLEKLINVKGLYTPQSEIDRASLALFPFSNMHYVCGTELPLPVKVAIFKARVARAVITRKRDNDAYTVLVMGPPAIESLNTSFQQLAEISQRRGVDRGELGILFDVYYQRENLRGEAAVLRWMTRTFALLFHSEFFQLDQNGEYRLVLHNEERFRDGYIRIGQLLGLALMNNVGLGLRLDINLLRELLSEVPCDMSPDRPAQVRRLRSGFYQVTTTEALFGSYGNVRKLLNEQELSDALCGL